MESIFDHDAMLPGPITPEVLSAARHFEQTEVAALPTPPRPLRLYWPDAAGRLFWYGSAAAILIAIIVNALGHGVSAAIAPSLALTGEIAWLGFVLKRQRKILAYGRPCVGVITGWRLSTSTWAGRFEYSYKDLQATWHDGLWRTGYRFRLRGPTVGTPILVFVDPPRPGAPLPEPGGYFRIRRGL